MRRGLYNTQTHNGTCVGLTVHSVCVCVWYFGTMGYGTFGYFLSRMARWLLANQKGRDMQ